MKLIYRLSEELENDPQHVATVQALTLDATKPHLGLRGTRGLFGSQEWWERVDAGLIPTKRLSGVIAEVYVAGMDHSAAPNSFDFMAEDGHLKMEGMYANSKQDLALYQVGRHVEVTYVLEELKMPMSDGCTDYLEIVLELSISR